MKRVSVLFFAFAVSAAVALGGCQQVAQKAVEQATGITTDQKGDSFTIKGKDGETVNFNSQVPAELKDFPMPANFKLDSSGSMSSGGDRVSVASYKGKGDLQSVTQYYQQTLPGLGWKEEGNMMTDDGGVLVYASTKDAADALTVTIGKGEGDAVEVSVLYGKSKNTPVAGGTDPISRAAASPTPATTDAPTATPKPEATATSAPPKTVDASAVPAEIRQIPIPSGFTPLKDGIIRLSEGGSFKMASARYSGAGSVQDVGASLQGSLLAKGWEESEFADTGDEVVAYFTNPEDNSSLIVLVTKTDTGTELNLQLVAGE